jgi:glycosyltransferase involved in cell wall biosynthesis
MVARYLSDAGTVSVSSRRLQTIFAPFRQVWLAENGFDPDQFMVRNRSGGRLRIGWAGNAKDPCKGLEDILRPAVAPDFELHVAGGGLDTAAMCNFYNSIDVICVASTAEGAPVPLIEGMACGCFPVVVDVGLVPELVTHRRNGLIVNRTPAAFRAAFQWCAVNVERVREAGRQNAETMLRTRAWSQFGASWRAVFRHALRALATSSASKNKPGIARFAPPTPPCHLAQASASA